MRINGLTVSVGYAHELQRGIDLWREGLHSLVVVTDCKDDETVRVAERAGATVYRTDSFYANGASFAKSVAMEEARKALMPWLDWGLFFDADMVPPQGWKMECAGVAPGYLYGARRVDELGRLIPDKDVVGYFQLFHTQDPAVSREPVLEPFSNASGYDSVFWERWGKRRCRWLGLTLTHYGEPGRNWCGVGNGEALKRVHAERKRRGGWRHERMNP